MPSSPHLLEARTLNAKRHVLLKLSQFIMPSLRYIRTSPKPPILIMKAPKLNLENCFFLLVTLIAPLKRGPTLIIREKGPYSTSNYEGKGDLLYF